MVTIKLQKNIFKLSLPIFIELLFFTLLGTIDTFMLNAYNKDAVSAVVNANSIINLFTVMLTVVATGIVVVLSQTLGRKDSESEPKIVGSGLFFNILLGLFISIILYFVGPLLLIVVKTPSDVILESTRYIKTISSGFFFLSISQACGAIFRSYSKPYVIMGVAMIGNIINVLLNYCLIFGNFGLPELGVYGAAIGTLTSNIISGILAIIAMQVILKYNIKNVKFSKEKLKDILKIGIPSAFENFLYNLSQFCIMIAVNMILINSLEGLAATARAYVVTILNFVMLFSISIANGNQIIVGYLVGEKQYDEAKKFTFRNFRYLLIIVLIVVGILNIFWRQFLSLLTEDPIIIEALEGIFLVAFLLEIGRSCNIMFIAALRAVGDIIFPVIMGVISMYGVAVLFSFLLAIYFDLGILGIFIAQAMDECFRGTFMLFRFKNHPQLNS